MYRFLFSALVLLVFAAQPAGAARHRDNVTCTCTPAELKIRAMDTHQIYVGRVTRIDEVPEMRQAGKNDPPVKVELEVSEIIKGLPAGTKKDTLYSSLTRTTCTGHPFVAGKEYLVYAYRRLASTYEDWSLYDFPTGTHDVGGLCGGTVLTGTPEVAAEIVRLREMRAAGQIPDKALSDLERPTGTKN